MKTHFTTPIKLLLLIVLCSGLLFGCADDDDSDKSITDAIMPPDPAYGFLVNSTPYRLTIDFGEKETFQYTLNPGTRLAITLDTRRTYILHVVVLNPSGRVVSEYINAFYVDEIPLDNQLYDLVCSWYVEFTANYPEYGFANKYGT